MIDHERTVLEYELVEETDYSMFNSSASAKISMGLQPCGELFIDTDQYNMRHYIQAFIKYEE